ncbi:MAG: hypothetical protein QXV17_11955 [Candidatus Micrarchaeaceae archaeon]
MNFTLVNGTYSYVASAGNEFSTSSGVFTVSGQPVVLAVIFSLKTFNITIEVSGLPKGDSWFITLSGITASGGVFTKTFTSTQSAAVLSDIPMGKYTYQVSLPYGNRVVSETSIFVNAPNTVIKVSAPALISFMPFIFLIIAAGVILGGFFVYRWQRKVRVDKTSEEK